VIVMAQDSCKKMEVVGMDHTEQEVVAWDDDHGKWDVMVDRNSIHWADEVDIPYVEDHLANRSSEVASIIGFVWVACRLNQRRNRVLMTCVSTWQLVFLISQLIYVCL